MATFMDKESSEILLKCPNCLDKLSSPKQLSCTHFVCKTCMDDLIKGEGSDTKERVKCPVCEKLTDPKDLKDMPIVNQMLVMCDHCDENNPTQATVRCVD